MKNVPKDREGVRWKEASVLSEKMVGELATLFEDLKGEIFLVNVPSAYDPSGAIGEKPLFAYNIEVALNSRLPHGLYRSPIIVNHLWLKKAETGISSITKIDSEHFSIHCDNRAHFSFHTGDFISGRLKPNHITIRSLWGELQIINSHRLVIAYNSPLPRTIVFFDGFSWKVIVG